MQVLSTFPDHWKRYIENLKNMWGIAWGIKMKTSDFEAGGSL